MSFPLPTPPPVGTILEDTPCRKCSYNLRLLAITGVCPECGTRIALSLHGSLLRHADPGFLQQLVAGVRVMMISLWGIFVLAIFRRVPHVLEVAAGVIAAAAFAGLALGTWLLTARDPSGAHEEEYRRLRVPVRALAILQLCISPGLAFVVNVPPMVFQAMQYASFAVQLPWGIFLLFYLKWLEKRTSQEFNARDGIMWPVSVYMVVTCLWIAITILTGSAAARMGGYPQSWLNLLFLYGGFAAFFRNLKPEVAAAKVPSTWRSAGAVVYSVRRVFRGE